MRCDFLSATLSHLRIITMHSTNTVFNQTLSKVHSWNDAETELSVVTVLEGAGAKYDRLTHLKSCLKVRV